MSWSDPAGDVQRARPGRAAGDAAQVPHHREGGDRRPRLLHVQPLPQGGLEHVQQVLRWLRL